MILGHHTVQEVRDLIAQYEWRINFIDSGLLKIMSQADDNLKNDWAAFKARWQQVKGNVNSALMKAKIEEKGAELVTGPLIALTGGITGVDDNVAPAEDAYNMILKAGSPTYPAYTDTDLPGLETRVDTAVKAATGQNLAPSTPMPKNKALDVDDVVYSTALAAENAVKSTTKGIGELVWENKFAAIGIAAAGLGALALYKKI